MVNLRIMTLLLFLFPQAVPGKIQTAPPPEIPSSPSVISSEYPEGVAWWGTWDGALAEAKRTGKPILLLSAAPQCHGVPGIW